MASTQTVRGWVKSALRPLVRAGWPRRVDLPESLWRHEPDPEGVLALEGVRLDGLLSRWGSPLHVLDLRRLDENAADFLAIPPGARAGCEPYFSYKTNPVPAVLSRLDARGIGAEVISEYELWLALRLGVSPERIVFNGPGRSPASLTAAIERGVLIHLNNREEIDLVARLAQSIGRKARVGIRVTMAEGWNAQFGESVNSGAAVGCFREAQRRPQLDLIALHCHQGEEISSEAGLRLLLGQMVDLLGRLRQELGLELKILDLGGCLASRTVSPLSGREVALNRMFGADLLPRSPDEVLTIRSYIGLITSTLERECAQANLPRPRIFVEPGRAMTGNTQMLLCRVVNLKAACNADPIHAVLDAGVNIAEPLKNRYHQLFLVAGGIRARKEYRLVGPICTPMDVLYPSWEFPELRRGDALAIMDSGAYFVPFSTSFSFPQPGIVALGEGKESLIRRAETFEDMVKRDLG
jgi:diaminopimelate decarboxylase